MDVRDRRDCTDWDFLDSGFRRNDGGYAGGTVVEALVGSVVVGC